MGIQQSAPVNKNSIRLGYVPAVGSLLASAESKKNKISNVHNKVLVIGSGCAGLGVAWHLNRVGVDVTVYESLEKLGGHANTISVDGVEVDTGFMVFNTLNYPNLCGFFDEVGIEGVPTTMGFSVSVEDGTMEWCSDSLAGLFATPGNALNPRFYTMFRDVFHFNKEALHLISLPENHPSRNVTVRAFLKEKGLSDAFRDLYLIPMTAAIWSATTNDMLNFPAVSLFTFLNNHLLLQVSAHINWMTPKNRSQEYVGKIARELGDRAKCNKRIVSFKRVQDTVSGDWKTTVIDADGVEATFDTVVFACHPDQALDILGGEASGDEKKWLGQFRYATNDTYVHWDEDLMPKSKAAWTSWNYIGSGKDQTHDRPVFVTYWLNKLQSVVHPTGKNILVSLNPSQIPNADKTWVKINYAHPQFSPDTIRAQRGVARDLQGKRSTYFCGAWMGYGFHEDGFRSGVEVAMAISGVPVPWVAKWGQQAMIPAPKHVVRRTMTTTTMAHAGRPLLWLTHTLTQPLVTTVEHWCKQQLLTRWRQEMVQGKLTLILPRGEAPVVIEGKRPGRDVTVQVHQNQLFVRLPLEGELGLTRSYIAGEWEVVGTGPFSSGLTELLLLWLDNRPNDQVATGIDVSRMMTTWLGSVAHALQYRLTMDNTSIAATRYPHIHAHYDLSNELFETFLDRDNMMSSSALFDTDVVRDQFTGVETLHFTDTLEQAQWRQIDALLERLEPITPNMQLLDIGVVGSGGVCLRAAEKYGCRVLGITSSAEHKALAEQKLRARRLQHLVTVEVVDDYGAFAQRSSHRGRFKRIVSCDGMIEATSAAVGHLHDVGVFFEAVDALLAPRDGIFVMQAITAPDVTMPSTAGFLHTMTTMMMTRPSYPSLSMLLKASSSSTTTLHLDNATNKTIHYAETLRRWRHRFNEHLPRVIELGFDDAFIRWWNLYLCACEAAFERQLLNLHVLTFARAGNIPLRKPRLVERNIVGDDDAHAFL